MDEAEFSEALRSLLEQGCDRAMPYEHSITRAWLVATAEGYLTEAGYTTTRGRDKLRELNAPRRYWIERNAVSIVVALAAIVTAVATTLALVLRRPVG